MLTACFFIIRYKYKSSLIDKYSKLMQENPRTQANVTGNGKQGVKREKLEEKGGAMIGAGLGLRGFKSLNRKSMYSPSMVPINTELNAKTSNTKQKQKQKESKQNKQNQQTNISIQNSNTNNITNKENIGDNANDKENGERGGVKIGYRYLHGRAASNIANRSRSKNRKENYGDEKGREGQEKPSEVIGDLKQKEKERKSTSMLQNSPIINPYKEIAHQKSAKTGSNTKQSDPLANINMFRSPTKQEPYITMSNTNGSVIYESVSKDGQYRVTSRCLSSEELKEASELEHHINQKSKKQSIKQLQQNSSAHGHSHPHSSSRNAPTSGQVLNTSSPRVNKYTLDPSKISSKENGNIKAYAVNSNQGISRKYNEDRVSIILNIMKNGVRASFFAIYDGHGGANCCDFLTQNLHQFVFNSKYFPTHPRQALIQGMKMAETKFIQATKALYREKKEVDRSGSCAIILLIIGDDCYIANLGDSRAVLSTCNGKPMYSLSRDHKPTDSGEQARILKEGGKIYRTEMIKIRKQNVTEFGKEEESRGRVQNQIIIGPLRVYPGKLSVTRTFGDIEAKQPELGGIRNCISTDPQICKYTLTGKEDFIILGCDGLFQKLDSEQVIEQAWKSIKRNKKSSLHQAVGAATQSIVKLCMDRKGTDNITAIMVCLGSLGLETSLNDYASV